MRRLPLLRELKICEPGANQHRRSGQQLTAGLAKIVFNVGTRLVVVEVQASHLPFRQQPPQPPGAPERCHANAESYRYGGAPRKCSNYNSQRYAKPKSDVRIFGAPFFNKSHACEPVISPTTKLVSQRGGLV